MLQYLLCLYLPDSWLLVLVLVIRKELPEGCVVARVDIQFSPEPVEARPALQRSSAQPTTDLVLLARALAYWIGGTIVFGLAGAVSSGVELLGLIYVDGPDSVALLDASPARGPTGGAGPTRVHAPPIIRLQWQPFAAAQQSFGHFRRHHPSVIEAYRWTKDKKLKTSPGPTPAAQTRTLTRAVRKGRVLG